MSTKVVLGYSVILWFTLSFKTYKTKPNIKTIYQHFHHNLTVGYKCLYRLCPHTAYNPLHVLIFLIERWFEYSLHSHTMVLTKQNLSILDSVWYVSIISLVICLFHPQSERSPSMLKEAPGRMYQIILCSRVIAGIPVQMQWLGLQTLLCWRTVKTSFWWNCRLPCYCV